MAKEHEDKLPQTVRIDVKGREMDALFTIDKPTCATVKLTSENLALALAPTDPDIVMRQAQTLIKTLLLLTLT